MSDLITFLNSNRTNNGNITHCGLFGRMRGKYCINDKDLHTFFDLYAIALDTHLSLAECHLSYGPIVIDLDFLFDYEVGLNRIITTDFIKSFIKLYNSAIDTHISCAQRKIAYVFQKPHPVIKDGNIKDGIHIIYPDIVIDTDIQLHIRETVVNLCNQCDLFSKFQCKNSTESIIDKCVIKTNCWLLYGSSKEPPKNVYSLIEAYDDEMSSVELPEESLRIRKFSIRNKSKSQYTLKRELEIPEIEVVTKNGQNDIELARLLISCLSEQRADEYSTWIELGFCLHNISHELLKEWINFSKRSTKFIEGECDKEWKKFKNDGLTIASLHRWSRTDNIERYNELIHDHNRIDLLRSLSCTDYDCGKVIFNKYKYTYVCLDPSKHVWLHYSGHYWKSIKIEKLKDEISDEITCEYVRLMNFFNKKLLSCEDEKQAEETKEKIKNCKKMIKNCKTTSFKKNLITESSYKFHTEIFRDFYKLENSKPHLIAFENGVYDLDKLELRDGRPDDYITFTTGIDYVPYNAHDDHVKRIESFLNKVLVDHDLHDYVMTLLASFLHGSNIDQKFHIWTGTGSNGKSKLVEFYQNTLNDYASKCNVSLLTSKRSSSNAASPDKIKLKGRRFVYTQEPDSGDQINAGLMKELTGGDTIDARALYNNDLIEFVPQFNMVLCCNDLPSVPSSDQGTWRRMRTVPFKTKFIKNPDPDDKYQMKKEDVTFLQHKESRQAFMSIIMEYYKKYTDTKEIDEPDVVMESSRSYEKESNKALEYVDEQLIQHDKDAYLNISSLYSHFKSWVKDNHNLKVIPNRKQLKFEVEKKFGQMTKHGWKLKFMSDDL